ncbi:M20 family metallopeptidase [Seohaeicola zhoushanensis]|uniref:Carboxypeptidase n=1 Tax=Seohaeicola zhoushanensis TaxID=1569283 RepID=A0A8J3H0Z1_9RHOB|nr:M20 family metallopeptidase [Seohaeicola zhoushanensis]GHF68852.1 carboxypeptidase [Seohaeicola zhoushanensis]
MPLAAKFNETFRSRLDLILADIAELVAIESGSYDVEGVTRTAHWIGDRLEAQGFETLYEAVPERGERLTAVRRGTGKGKVMILGHADTVWPRGTLENWPFEIDGPLATGPGVGDMRGGLVLALHALAVATAAGNADFKEIKFILVSDEELGSPLSRTWIEENAQASDWVLTLEPGRPNGGYFTSRGAVGAFYIEATGKTAHAAANYRKGASAIRPLATLVPQLEALTDLDAGTIVNIGVFEGGSARQVIPGFAKLHVDMRARTPETAADLQAKVEALIASVNTPEVPVVLKGGWTRPAWAKSEGTQKLFDIVAAAAEEIGTPCVELTNISGGSDASFCGALGVATIDGLGPTCNDICSRDETIVVESLVGRGAVFAALLAELSN